MKKLLFYCLALLAFASCKKDDPCDGITCLNGGTCANGACNCPTGYEGSDCSQQTKPTRINIKSITVTEYPSTTSTGASWDFSNGADVYVALSLNGVELSNNRLEAYQNELAPVSWASLPTDFEMSDVTNQYTLSVIDKDDFPPDQFLGGINFTPYSSTNGFPKTMTLSCSSCVVAFEVELTYEF